MKSVLVIANKEIAQALTSQLKEVGIRTYCLTESNYVDTNTLLLPKDLFSTNKQDLPFISTVIYFPEVDNQTDISYRKSYLHGLTHLLSIIPKATKIIYGSSTMVYGDQLGQIVTEHTPKNTETPREQALACAEDRLIESGNPFTILRSGQLYSDTLTYNEKIKSNKVHYSQRIQIINHLHIDDLIQAIITTLPYQGVFNITDRQPLPINTLLALMSSKLGVSVKQPKKWIPREKGVRASNTKLLATGFNFKHPTFISFQSEHQSLLP